MGGNFKFQVQDTFLEYLFLEIWRFEKRIALSGKKPPLIRLLMSRKIRLQLILTLLTKIWTGKDSLFVSLWGKK